MLIRRLKVSGLLSFGPKGIDLSMEPLNVLIGPNGSGKSNLLEVLGLLRAAPKNLAEPVKRRGGIWEWLWKGKESPGAGTVEVIVDSPDGERPLRHTLTVVDNGGRLQVIEEGVVDAGVSESDADWCYRLSEGRHAITLRPRDTARIEVAHSEAKLEESVLSQIRDPHMYPALSVLQERYERIRAPVGDGFDPGRAIFSEAALGFIRETQPREWARLEAFSRFQDRRAGPDGSLQVDGRRGSVGDAAPRLQVPWADAAHRLLQGRARAQPGVGRALRGEPFRTHSTAPLLASLRAVAQRHPESERNPDPSRSSWNPRSRMEPGACSHPRSLAPEAEGPSSSSSAMPSIPRRAHATRSSATRARKCAAAMSGATRRSG